MPYENRCDRSQGLDSFVQKNRIEAPKFTFGDVVQCPYISDDDGKAYKDVGIVQGFFYSENKSAWIYWVKWTHLEKLNTQVPIFEEADESWLMCDCEECASLSPCDKKTS